MTITLKPETEQALRAAAARRGVTPDDVIEERLQDLRAAEDDAARAGLQARVKAARGSLAHLGPSTRMQDKAQERAREERRWQQQDAETHP